MSEKSTYIYILRPARVEMLTEGPTPEEAATIEVHAAYLKKLVEEGVMLHVGRTTNMDATTFGVAIFYVGSKEEARQIMESAPGIQGSVHLGALYPYKIVFEPKP
jgi:uncharacterized protein